MSESAAVLLMMNNYFHDVATALLLGSGFAMWLMHKRFVKEGSGDIASIRAMYLGMSRLALFALVWIIIGGIPRTIYYSEFEWAAAAGRGQVHALIVKHILMFIFLGWGGCLWFRLKKAIGND
jgi:hypothetical protein